jgi:trehalose 6-phosphate synthase/phosphatase
MQGVSKGTIAKELILSMVEKGKPPEFVLCIGDDRSDEHMFESIANAMEGFPQAPLAEVFACTVGQKPSKARYYVDGTSEVIRILDALTRPLEVSDINEGEHRSFPSMSDMKLLP